MSTELSSPLIQSQTIHALPTQDQDDQLVSATKVSLTQAGLYANGATPNTELDGQQSGLFSASKATRKNISSQIPAISSGGLERSKGSVELSPSPSSGTSSASTPASPIAAIIDQDAEKFRIYMNKLNSPNRRNVSAPIQITGDKQDLASALGQAVAMENIQNQIEIQNQLLGQVQSM
jgi:hypothetical protein